MVVLTHWHWDHIFGLPALPDTVSIASAKTRKEMEKLLPFSWSDEAIDERVREGTYFKNLGRGWSPPRFFNNLI